MCCIFIDFKNAYNTVNREIVFKYMKDKQILDENEINFLKALY